MKVRIATYNIRKGGRRRRRFLADVVQGLDPDVTVLQEATDPRVVRYVADAAGARVVIHAPGRSVAMLSRVATTEARWHRMARARNFVEVELADAGIRVIGVHLSAGLSGRGERRRAAGDQSRAPGRRCAARRRPDPDRRRPERRRAR